MLDEYGGLQPGRVSRDRGHGVPARLGSCGSLWAVLVCGLCAEKVERVWRVRADSVSLRRTLRAEDPAVDGGHCSWFCEWHVSLRTAQLCDRIKLCRVCHVVSCALPGQHTTHEAHVQQFINRHACAQMYRGTATSHELVLLCVHRQRRRPSACPRVRRAGHGRARPPAYQHCALRRRGPGLRTRRPPNSKFVCTPRA